MQSRSRLNFWLTLIGVSIIVSIGSAYLYLIKKSPLPFAEMDFDDNGLVTLSELHYANSYGTRTTVIDNKDCIEYYALKDNKRLKVSCD